MFRFNLRRTALLLLTAWALTTRLPADNIIIDKAKQEVRLPFTFTEATQIIEVFGCSPGGPTHETIVVFKAKGSRIAEALEAIGARPKSFWQAASPQNFMHTQGDRILVLLEWPHGDHKHAVAAERLLWRNGEDLPEPVQGFSYLGEKVRHGDPPVTKVPDCVEITMGGTGRQSSVSSILTHPTALPFLMDHVSGLDIHPRFAHQIQELAAANIQGTMILRRVTETELLDYKIKHQPPLDWGFETVYEAQKPIAKTIDALKATFVERRQALDRLTKDDNPTPEKAHQVTLLMAELKLLSWQIQDRYIALYQPTWAFHHQVLKDRLANFEASKTLCHDFLGQYLPERIKLEALRFEKIKMQGAGKPIPEDLALKLQLSKARVMEAVLRKDLPFHTREMEKLKKGIAREKGRDSDFLLNLLKIDLAKARIKRDKALAEADIQVTLQEEAQAKLAGRQVDLAAILARRNQLKAQLANLEIQWQITLLDDEIRWAREDAASRNADIKARAEKKLAELQAQKKALQEKLKPETDAEPK